ncbi:MAG: type II secretion system F family protein [Deltaproteobacteria bacterium]|nr:type II secretion system F family protein [Deltaproteobacteria bacterium]
MSGIIFLLVFGSVFFLTLVVYDIMRSGMLQYQEKYLNPKIEDLSDMFLFIDPKQMMLLNLSVMVVGFIIGILAFGYVVTAILTVLGFFTPSILVKYYSRRRVRKFNEQLVDALQNMSNALKAGLSLQQAMGTIAQDFQPPISQEFGLALKEMKLGVSIEDALKNMGERVKCEDLDLFITSTNIARTMGGNLSEMFENIANTIRQRFKIEGRIRALTAQGKLQGFIIGVMPIVIWFVMDWLRPDLMEPMLKHWFGYALIGAIIFMELIGAYVIKRIVDIDV